jgi:hypothetical protein
MKSKQYINLSIKRIIKYEKPVAIKKKPIVADKKIIEQSEDQYYEETKEYQNHRHSSVIKGQHKKAPEPIKNEPVKPVSAPQQNISKSQQNISKPQQTTQPQVQPQQNQPQQTEREANINIQIDPNNPDLKNAKVNINMDAETAFKLYQSNKQYLPSTQQVINGVTKTAEVVSSVSSKDDVVTGNKPQQQSKKGLFDPLTSLFGVKKDQSSTQPKKGQF